MNDLYTLNGITLTAPPVPRQGEILTRDALDFVKALHRATSKRREELLRNRCRQR